MILNRYFGSHATESLRDARLMVASPNTFNDPFECMYRPIGTMTIERANEDVRARVHDPNFLDEVRRGKGLASILEAQAFVLDNVPLLATALFAGFDRIVEATTAQREQIIEDTMRVVCFSASTSSALNEILMWAHYADKHRGVRIGFDLPERAERFTVQRVDYSDSRVAVDMGDFEWSEGVQGAVKRSLRTKSSAWAYENEYRLMTTPTLCEPGTEEDAGKLFIPIRREWVRRLDFGSRFIAERRQSIVNLIKREYPGVEMYQARYHKSDYCLEFEPVP
jgi:hypothetical protein